MRFSTFRQKIGTQDEVAELLGVDPQRIRAWEQGRRPSGKEIRRVAKVMDMTECEAWKMFEVRYERRRI